MRTKIFGLALILSLAGALGACESSSTGPSTTTTPAAGEPTDAGSPATTPTTTPAATTPATPATSPTKKP